MLRLKWTIAAAAGACAVTIPSTAHAKSANIAIEAAVAYTLQHVKNNGTYHSVLLSPQATFYWGETNGSGPFITVGDALVSSIVSSPSEAEATGATKLNLSQVYVMGGYRFHIIDPATKLTLGVGYLNQKIDAVGDKFGRGPFISLGIAVPLLDKALNP